MKAFKLSSLFFASCVFGMPFGYCSESCKKEDVRVAEKKALDVIRTSTDMEFLLQAQKELEIRKYDLYNASHDQLPYRPVFNRKECSSKPCQHHGHKKFRTQH